MTTYKRPKRVREAYIDPKNLYNQLFNLYKNAHQKLTLETLSKITNKFSKNYFISVPLHFTEIENSNNVFKNELLQSLKNDYEMIGFSITLMKGELYHMISGILFVKQSVLELYDPNAQVVYPLNTKPPSRNNLYDLVFSYLDPILNSIKKFQYTAHVERAYVPSSCGISTKGICSLWSILYVYLRMNKNIEETHHRIFNISASKNSNTFMIKLMKLLKEMKLNQNVDKYNEFLEFINLKEV
jgi:hypothetical protein